MKKRNVKSIMSLALMSLLLTVFAPTDIFAQRDNRRDNNKKEKVVTPVKHYKKEPRRGAQVTALPKNTVVVKHRNNNYHYRENVVYEVVRV